MYKNGYGNIANKDKVINYLEVAFAKNPGPWLLKAWQMGQVAEKMSKDLGLDPDLAFASASLASLGQAYDKGLKANLFAYDLLRADSYFFLARIAITHTFPINSISSYWGEVNLSEKEIAFIESFLYKYDYNDYDYLSQYLYFLVDGSSKELGNLENLDKNSLLSDEVKTRIYQLDEYFTSKLSKNLYEYKAKIKRSKFPYRLFSKEELENFS